MRGIYLDNAATTRARDSVLEVMREAESNLYYNSAAQYSGALSVKKAIESASREIHGRLTRTMSGTLVFTSGATESNNIVMFGKATNPRHHIIVLAGEHSSVYSPSVALRNNGFDVDYVPLLRDGAADLRSLGRLVRPTTSLVVFGMINSDTGVMQPVREIVDIIRRIAPKAHVHCDAVQAFCKFDFYAEDLGVDSIAISAHKIYGPKGVGALWLKKGARLHPIMYGGSQQDYRPGTENNASIIGFADAVKCFDTNASFSHVNALYKRLMDGLPSRCTLTIDGGKRTHTNNPYIANIMLSNVFGNTVMNALSSMGIYVGLGSACATSAAKNRTLIAMGIPEDRTRNVLRVSFGIYNTLDEVDEFNRALGKVLDELA